MKGALYLGLLISLVAILGSCLNTDRPSALGITQLNLLNKQMDLLHEEVAASQTDLPPNHVPTAMRVGSRLVN